MSTIPETLEKLQYEVLQGELKDNPYLQPHSIPARDKELKTNSKRIIPAINELLKLIQTCKTSIDTYSAELETRVRAVVDELAVTLKQEYAKEVDQRFTSLDEEIKKLVADQVKEQANTIGGSGTGTGAGVGGGSDMRKKFISKETVTSTGIVAPFKFTEIQNIQEQIVPIIKTTYAGGGYINVDEPYNFKNTSSSAYEMYNTPLELRVDPETDEVTVINRGAGTMVVYFFEME